MRTAAILAALLLAAACASHNAFDETKAKAEQGSARDQGLLGAMYHYGKNVGQNDAEAVKWHRKSAEQGWHPAQNNLGLMYHEGRGVQQDYVEAANWFHKAAEQGDFKAQFTLGHMYWRGRGVPQDNIQAFAWFKVANANGRNAQIELERLAHYMNPEQIAEAQKLAAEYFEKYNAKSVSDD